MERVIPRTAEIRRSEWGDRPKEAVAAYVEASGFLVPRRYGFKEAKQILQNGGAVLARSEHPDEANGPSGLLRSTYMHEQHDEHFGPRWYLFAAASEVEFRAKMNDDFQGSRELSNYCRLGGLDYKTYAGATEYSLWEPVPGANIGMVRDGAGGYTLSYSEVRGKTQLITYSPECGAQLLGLGTPYGGHLQVHRLVEYAERLYGLDKFAGRRGKFEIQLGDDGQLYFLQWHEIASRAKALPAGHADVSGLRGMECTYRGVMPEGGFTIQYIDQFPTVRPTRAFFTAFGRQIAGGAGYIGRVRERGIGEFVAHHTPVLLNFKDTGRSDWKNWDHTRDSLVYTPPLKLYVPELEDQHIRYQLAETVPFIDDLADGESVQPLRRLRLSVIPLDATRATVFVHPPEQKS